MRVVWLFGPDDASIARDLINLATVLEDQGLIKNWSSLSLPSGANVAEEQARELERAEVVLIVPGEYARHTLESLRQSRGKRVILIPIRYEPNLTFLHNWPTLPRDGVPLLVRQDTSGGMLDVIRGLREIASFRAQEALPPATPGPPVQTGGSSAIASIDDIFRLDGPPTVNFVEPPGFDELKHRLRTMGTGLIVEGPSRVGKSTAIKKAMEALGVADPDQIWWHGQRPPVLDEFQRVLDELLAAQRDTWLFIDDFHYLTDERYRWALASCMKILADQGVRHAKITLIGINPLGSSLVQVMPDLAGRFRVQRLDIEKDWLRSTKINQLIELGEHAANIRFTRRDEFVMEAAGSFFLAQYLCNQAATKAGVHAAQATLVEVSLGPADVIEAIQGELAARFRTPLLQFAAFDAVPPPRGAGLSLLWLLSRSGDGFVPLKEAKLRFPMLSAAFDWFLQSNLSRCFHDHPQLQGLLYYNGATATLTMEEPQLKFYLRRLNWVEFAEASGHDAVTFHPEDGPLWKRHLTISVEPGTLAITGGEVTRTVGRVARILHLSDLHFSTSDHAKVAYSQLALDLRQLGVERLDGLIVSGDLVNRAEPEEYDATRLFLGQLQSGFSLIPRQIAIVPGNHDVSWKQSYAAYTFHRPAQFREQLAKTPPNAIIEHSTEAVEVRDEANYRRRFESFARLYELIKSEPYSLDYSAQGTLDLMLEGKLLVLGLNSAWEIDHHYRDRASIHAQALANALIRLPPPSPDQLRIAVFHHPIHSGEDSRLRDDAFLQQLAVAGFRVVLHGHVHRADTTLYRYERGAGGRQIEVVAAGTFGATTREWVPGYPLQYNLFLIGDEAITVETRCRREVNGAWEPDARWRQGPGQDPLPRYVIER